MSGETWPAWATETVHVEPHDDRWLERAAVLRQEVATTLAGLISEVHHVGSTAVPGLPAKPIIDLMAGVDSLDVAADAADRLAPLDWHLVPPELDARPWRRFLIKVAADRRAAHLHLMQPESSRWREQLVFRDRLRADPGKAAEYAELKRRLAVERADNREAYTDGKEAFVRTVLREAGLDPGS